MATIWEENDRSGSAQEPEFLLASWRSTIDYFNSKKEVWKDSVPPTHQAFTLPYVHSLLWFVTGNGRERLEGFSMKVVLRI